ncbi:hypothetical protein N7456_007499, partial [Penicillium angulare]
RQPNHWRAFPQPFRGEPGSWSVNMALPICTDDTSFGPVVVGCRGNFDFTLKFEKIILTILPSAIFIALAIPRVVVLAGRPITKEGNGFKFTKLTVTGVYAALRLAILIITGIDSFELRPLSIATDTVCLLAAIVISALSFVEHSRSPRPSILLSSFLSLTTLFDIAQVRTLWLLANNPTELIYVKLLTAAIVCKAVLFVLESLQRRSWLRWDWKIHSPEETTGIYGLGSYFWLAPIFAQGYKKILDLSDLYPLDQKVAVETLQPSFARYAKNLCFNGDKNGLTKALARALLLPILLPVLPRIALLAFSLCQPFLIESILSWLEEPNNSLKTDKGYGLIGGTVLIYGGIAIATALYWYLHERAMFMSRGCLTSLIYRKTIQAPISAADDKEAVTLMSTDVERIRMGLMQLHEFWANPLQVGIACWLLQRQIGAAFVAPIVVVLICVLASTVVMRFVGPKQTNWMKGIQKRVAHTANVIGNMKHLKISGLTKPVADSIQQLQIDELDAGGAFRLFLVVSVGIGFTPMLLTPVFTFAFVFKDLDATTIFTSLSYLQLLSNPLSSLFQSAPQLVSAFSCLSRIQLFLEKEARHDFRQVTGPNTSKGGLSGGKFQSVIEIRGGNFGWDKDSLALKNINISLAQGLNMVIGPVACGKSTLCKALLGETPNASGQVFVRTKYRRVGYCEQVPFLPNAKIRDAIVGFSSFDEKRYNSVVEATMLLPDLLLLPDGDQTKIGSDGLALSGGQKQRISLARALYLHCDLLILDDILGGLDATTEEHVFWNVFGPSGLLKTRETIVVLCTNAVRHLPLADYVVALGKDGAVVESGTFQELIENKQYVHSLGFEAGGNKITRSATATALASESDADTQSPQVSSIVKKDTASNPTAKDLSRNLGDFKVFKYYCASIGSFRLIAFAIFGVLSGFLSNFPTIWVSYWSENSFNQSKSFYIGIYALLQFLALTVIVVEAAIGMLSLIRTSGSRLHDAALRTLISAPLRFFSKTDTGVVTNLFSQDMTLLDGELPQAFINTSISIWMAIGSAAVVATSSAYILITYPFCFAVVYGVQRFYLRTSRQMRLLDLEAKSPLYTHFLDTIKGTATLRAFDWTEESVLLNNELLNSSQRPAYLLDMIQRWLSFVLDMLVAVIALLVVTLVTQLHSSVGLTGASLVSIMTFGKTLSNLVRMYTQLETSIGAVSRIKTFSDKTPSEDLLGEDQQPSASWPEKGKITVKHMSASYSEAELTEKLENSECLALRDLSFTIEAGQKVAICGRTGSGKSSIVLLLLRLLDPLFTCTGELDIDDVSLLTIDRSTLRRGIIAVPQDPTFFPDGTSFKISLDPFNESTDEECQSVLELTDLWSLVYERGGLSAGLIGDTLSHGQKQLFNLARAVLRRRIRAQRLITDIGETYIKSFDSRAQTRDGGVLILDEINSSVDGETQNTMRDVLWREFEGYTIIMVSHRLEMVMEFDRVFVMDKGQLVEDGAPVQLINKESGFFKDLWLAGKDKA